MSVLSGCMYVYCVKSKGGARSPGTGATNCYKQQYGLEALIAFNRMSHLSSVYNKFQNRFFDHFCKNDNLKVKSTLTFFFAVGHIKIISNKDWTLSLGHGLSFMVTLRHL